MSCLDLATTKDLFLILTYLDCLLTCGEGRGEAIPKKLLLFFAASSSYVPRHVLHTSSFTLLSLFNSISNYQIVSDHRPAMILPTVLCLLLVVVSRTGADSTCSEDTCSAYGAASVLAASGIRRKNLFVTALDIYRVRYLAQLVVGRGLRS